MGVTRFDVSESVLLCDLCSLHTVGNGPIPFSGPTPAYLAIVGEAPGKTEDAEGLPFVGPSGQLLRESMVAAGLAPEMTFFCNAVSCFPDRTPNATEINLCGTNLRSQLELANPRWVLLLGGVALSTFRPDLKISKARGHLFTPEATRWRIFVTFHPSYALHNGKGEKILRDDLVNLRNLMELDDDESWTNFVDDSCVICGVDMEDMAEHDLTLRMDAMGATYCDDCYQTKSPEGKRYVKEVKATERIQVTTGKLFK